MKLRTAIFLLFFLVALFCISPISSKGGRGGGGGGRSSGSRSSSSRGSSTRTSSSSSQSSQRAQSSSSNSNRQSHSSSSTDRRTSDKDKHRETSSRVQPSAPEMPDAKPSAPKLPSNQRVSPSNSNPHAYNPHFTEVDKSKLGGQSLTSNGGGNIRPENAPTYGTSNANAPPINPSFGKNQPEGSLTNIGSKQSNSGNPPAPGFVTGNMGNPPPYGSGNPPSYGSGNPAYGSGPGSLGNPPPYGSGTSNLGNPPPYGSGPGSLGNPPPYGYGTSNLGNPPPYGSGPGSLGNPPPYGYGTSNLGNPPPYGSGPGNFGNPSAYGSGPSSLGNPPPYGSGPGVPGKFPTYGGADSRYPYGSHQSGYPSPYGVSSGKHFAGSSSFGSLGPSGGLHSGMIGASAIHSSHSGYRQSDLNTAEKLKIYKRKGFLNSFLSLGKGSKDSKKPKMFDLAYPQKQYGRHEPRKYGVSPLYAILPMKILQKAPKPFKPSHYVKHWFLPQRTLYGGWRRRSYFNLDYDDDSNFGGRRCIRPIPPKNGQLSCYKSERGMNCEAKCIDRFSFPNGSFEMKTECWHFSGYWKPTRYLPACIPHCEEKCENGGVCMEDNKCRCTAEYRGPQCQYHFLQCDVRKLARRSRISWVCSHNVWDTTCAVKCRPPQVFASPPPEKYHCLPNGTWTPDTMPDCVDQQRLLKVE